MVTASSIHCSLQYCPDMWWEQCGGSIPSSHARSSPHCPVPSSEGPVAVYSSFLVVFFKFAFVCLNLIPGSSDDGRVVNKILNAYVPHKVVPIYGCSTWDLKVEWFLFFLTKRIRLLESVQTLCSAYAFPTGNQMCSSHRITCTSFTAWWQSRSRC